MQKFKYLGSVLIVDRKCDIEARKRIGQVKKAFQKLSKELRNRKVSLETKKRVLQYYVLSILLDGNES